MIRIVHPIAGGLALATIAGFWTASVAVELFGGPTAVAAVKGAIPYGFVVLIPALAVVGMSGMRLGRGQRRPLVAAKRRRMPVIAANGILVLVPSALVLAARAQAGELDAVFYAVQALELVAGGVNITLLGLCLRDGLRLARGRRVRVA